MIKNKNIAIIGLGYVGLPLAVEFGKNFPTIGYDVNVNRIQELKMGIDKTGETSKKSIQSSIKLSFSEKLNNIEKCNIYIVSVPTPIDKNNNPNLKILFNATKNIGSILKKNDIVIYESTVYPGCTEDDCVPILEKESGLKYNKDFFCGYSPERINPGDTKRTLTKIVKITSGSNPKVAEEIDNLYKSIITAGTYLAENIKIAEAAKIIENCQRDINIAFVNELSILFNKMNLDTNKVLDAASTKWNFLQFRPGLVGGHCIGVDPYYLTHKAKKIGYKSKIILSGRKLNDSIPDLVCNNALGFFTGQKLSNLNVLLLGITFKENCSDTRNSKVIEIFNTLNKKGINLTVYDPFAIKEDVKSEYNIDLIEVNQIRNKFYNIILVCVGHKQFLNLNLNDYIKNNNSIVYDLKNIYKNKNYLRL